MLMFQQCSQEDINTILPILMSLLETTTLVPILICILCFLRTKSQLLQRISIQYLKEALWFGFVVEIILLVITGIILIASYR